ncbi:MAG: glycerophosphodiester phosphodiesterase [Sciscionella sp.]|nr:glycerophosphodiester phosphodiesterase [Sciscionella sp.]
MDEEHSYLAGPYPRAFAHRGWHTGELSGLENSMSAFRRAIYEGYRYLEIDVHATLDGVVVVHHDPMLDRTTDSYGPIAALPWSAVRRARIGGVEPVPRLDELLAELPSALLNIDVKADSAVQPTIEVLNRTGAVDRVCVASFSDSRLRTVRMLGGPNLLTSMGPRSVAALRFGGRFPVLPTRRMISGRMAQVPETHTVGGRRITVVNQRMIHTAHEYGCEVHVWTVDDEPTMHRLLDLGVDGLITDRPDVLRAVLHARGGWPQRV